MNEIFGRGWELITRLLFPQQRKWVVTVLVVAGTSMLISPVWAPYVAALLEHFLGIKMPSTDAAPGLGVLVLAMGLGVHLFNEHLERHPKATQEMAPQPSPESLADRSSLEDLFSNLHLPSFDQFFAAGQESNLYVPVLHYYFGLKDFVQASEYHLHDAQIESEIGAFHNSLTLALSLDRYFTDTSNPDLQKFDPRWDTDVNPEAKRAFETFHAAVNEARERLRKVCRLIKSRYPGFDFKATNRAAIQDMLDYRRRAEEADANRLPQTEFVVMQAVLNMEGSSAYPNLKGIVGQLQWPQVEVQVALDRLIERGFVKHLYPGALHQKFTVLKPGRAYYVDQRKTIANSP